MSFVIGLGYGNSDNTFTFRCVKNERRILKGFLLGYLHQLFCELFQNKVLCSNKSLMECYVVDAEIIQLIIAGIVETGEYTLEGIAYSTHIPLDVIYEASCGMIGNQFSITLWIKIASLYMQVRPDIDQMLRDKLLERRNKNQRTFSLMLAEG